MSIMMPFKFLKMHIVLITWNMFLNIMLSIIYGGILWASSYSFLIYIYFCLPFCAIYRCNHHYQYSFLTHWGGVMHICFGNLTIIGSDNGLSPGRRQAIILTNAGILLIGPLGTNFSEILIKIQIFSFKKMRLKGSSAKWRPFNLGLNE